MTQSTTIKAKKTVEIITNAVKATCSSMILDHRKCPLCNGQIGEFSGNLKTKEWKAICMECKREFYSTHLHLMARTFLSNLNIAIYSLALLGDVIEQQSQMEILEALPTVNEQ